MPDTELQERIWTELEARPVCMVTTAADGRIRTRPMSGHVDHENHRILFVTHRNAGMIEEVTQSPLVSIAICREDRNFYAAITCRAEEMEDRELMREVWGAVTSAWFPGGPDDPHATLLSLTPVSAEVWEGPSSGVVVAFRLATARILGRTPDLGVNATVDMRSDATTSATAGD